MIEIKIGDCTERLKDLEDNSVDAVISDPPYGLKFMSKGWDDIGDGSQQREWHRKWLTEAYRVLKPNGVIKAFSGSRTFHHLIAMMEEIGFEDLKVESWSYGSGFPKSHNVSKAIDKLGGRQYKAIPASGVGFMNSDKENWNACHNQLIPVSEETEEAKVWNGWGTALKPSWEPVCVGVKK